MARLMKPPMQMGTGRDMVRGGFGLMTTLSTSMGAAADPSPRPLELWPWPFRKEVEGKEGREGTPGMEDEPRREDGRDGTLGVPGVDVPDPEPRLPNAFGVPGAKFAGWLR